MDKVGEAIAASGARIVLIDHHLYPENFADISISDYEVSSTCELVYEVCKTLGWVNDLTVQALEALLVGIITDTGSFKYSFSPKTLVNTSEIIRLGGDMVYVQDKLFNHLPEKSLRLLGHCLSKRMVIYPDKKAGLIFCLKRLYRFQYSTGRHRGYSQSFASA